MDNPIVISLVVSGIGMLILFLSLAFLCGLMYLMTAFIKDRTHEQEQEQGAGGRRQEASSRRLQAAVIAVALARAEQEQSPVGATGAKETTSAWRALHHQRQLTYTRPARGAR